MNDPLARQLLWERQAWFSNHLSNHAPDQFGADPNCIDCVMEGKMEARRDA